MTLGPKLRRAFVVSASLVFCIPHAGRASQNIDRPDWQLQADLEDLLEEGGCEVPSDQRRANLNQRYGARVAAIHQKLVEKYGDVRANADVIIAGACQVGWDEVDSRRKFEHGLKYWESCLRIRPSRKAVNCPL